MSRLRSDLLAAAITRTVFAAGQMATVARKGHPEGGILHMILDGPDGLSLWSEHRDKEGGLVWRRRPGVADRAAAERQMARETNFDPDAWLLDLEGRIDREALPGRFEDRAEN